MLCTSVGSPSAARNHAETAGWNPASASVAAMSVARAFAGMVPTFARPLGKASRSGRGRLTGGCQVCRVRSLRAQRLAHLHVELPVAEGEIGGRTILVPRPELRRERAGDDVAASRPDPLDRENTRVVVDVERR